MIKFALYKKAIEKASESKETTIAFLREAGILKPKIAGKSRDLVEFESVEE